MATKTKRIGPNVVVRDESYGSFHAHLTHSGKVIVQTRPKEWEERDDVTDFDAFVAEEIGRIKRWEERNGD